MSTPTDVAFQIFLLFAALIITAYFAICLVFHIVVMPGIATLDDRDFLRAFQVIDGVITKGNQPLFIFIAVGNVPAILGVLGCGISKSVNGPAHAALLILSTVAIFVVQFTTITCNIPRNKRVQELGNISLMENADEERKFFEPAWNRYNLIRTILLGLVSVYLLVLLLVTEYTPIW